LRNPAGYREVDYDDVIEATEAVATASLPMRLLDRNQNLLHPAPVRGCLEYDPARPSLQPRGAMLTCAEASPNRVAQSLAPARIASVPSWTSIDLVPPKHRTIAVVPGSSPGRRLTSTQLGQ
jgi:hypothetical protein